MDLSRAKTILIVAFLILNSILLYQLYEKRQIYTDYTALIQEEIEEVERLLESQGIYLNQRIPADITDKAFLQANQNDYSSSEVRESLPIKDDELGLHIDADGNIHYSWIYQTARENKAYHISGGYEEFARQYLFQGKSFRPYISSVEQGKGSVIFQQYFDEYPIFGVQATGVIDNNRIVSWQQTILKNIQMEETKRPILAAATAMRRIPNEIEQRPVTIEKIQLGYYNRFSEAESWLLPPVWAITLGSGEEIYINAFTGELEGLQEHTD